jgi:hypothetical protein
MPEARGWTAATAVSQTTDAFFFDRMSKGST